MLEHIVEIINVYIVQMVRANLITNLSFSENINLKYYLLLCDFNNF